MEDVMMLELNDGRVDRSDLAEMNVARWPKWRKTAVTSAIRVAGPFTVTTSEGDLKCDDGYLAVDARGYPYPISADEFHLIYVPADAAETVTS